MIILFGGNHDEPTVAKVPVTGHSIIIITLSLELIMIGRREGGIECLVRVGCGVNILALLSGRVAGDPMNGDNIDCDIKGAAQQADNTTLTTTENSQDQNIGKGDEQAHDRSNKSALSYIVQTGRLEVASNVSAGLEQGHDKKNGHVKVENLKVKIALLVMY